MIDTREAEVATDLAPFAEGDVTALKTRPEAIDRPTAVEALRDHYGIAAEVSELRGERDTNFLVHAEGVPRYVLRIANAAEQKIVAEFRAAELLHVAQAAPELPTPRLQRTRDGGYGFDLATESGPRHGQLVTYLPGTPVAAMSDARFQFHHLGETAARMSLALRGFQHPGAHLPLLWDIARLPQAMQFIAHTVEAEQARLVTWAAGNYAALGDMLKGVRQQVIHNDLNPHNIMMDAATHTVTGIIDFGDSVYSTLANDAAVACSYILDDSDDPLAPVCDLLAAYCRILPLTETEAGMLPTLIAARHALTILITNWRATLYPENAAYILRNQPRSVAGLRHLHALGRSQARDQIFAAIAGQTP